VAAALAQSTDHILAFFSMLRLAPGIYVGCLNLHDRLARKGEPICFAEPLASGKARPSARGLYDVCLSLGVEKRVVGNDVSADDKRLVMIPMRRPQRAPSRSPGVGRWRRAAL